MWLPAHMHPILLPREYRNSKKIRGRKAVTTSNVEKKDSMRPSDHMTRSRGELRPVLLQFADSAGA